MLTATVFLPASVDLEFRSTKSLRSWKSEKNARRDAAYQAYIKLHKAGMVTDHLIPLRESNRREPEARVSIATVREQMNPWLSVAERWEDSSTMYSRRLTFTSHDRLVSEDFDLVLPLPVPHIDPMTLYWDAQSSWTIKMAADMTKYRPSSFGQSASVDHTPALLCLAYGYRMKDDDERRGMIENRNIIRFVSASTAVTMDRIIPRKFELSSFLQSPQHSSPATACQQQPSLLLHPISASQTSCGTDTSSLSGVRRLTRGFTLRRAQKLAEESGLFSTCQARPGTLERETLSPSTSS